MFKVFKLGHRSIIDSDKIIGDTNKFTSTNQSINNFLEYLENWSLISSLKNTEYANENNFKRTKINIDGENIEDLEKCSSWTHEEQFLISFESEEDKKQLEPFISDHQRYNLLKYEKGDFFKNHIDKKQLDGHNYTCLIFIHDESHELKGGDLILHDKDNTFKIVFEPSKLKYNFMIIYSIDLFHEVLPVEEGVRYVFKTQIDKLIEENKQNEITYEDNNEFSDSCGGLMDGAHSADY